VKKWYVLRIPLRNTYHATRLVVSMRDWEKEQLDENRDPGLGLVGLPVPCDPPGVNSVAAYANHELPPVPYDAGHLDRLVVVSRRT